ncbi:SurA N-terminal domain-containing protein [Sideroxydans lithotrophicus]|uniref:Periplasmic chaperone PpiD n=1 Tax=Sideroxydans lithotrophicus (strain ES-1) TaxID=580332 RepID=D5CSU3_SIDLE|nr:SurA N-terminal domain-containing protein [Sideroxydans lithotrophicus]ADE12029.1 PpiC-type peptidyl-prolyl cis-trans isomerase [Sideroxydans lithotrophicus ES-1]
MFDFVQEKRRLVQIVLALIILPFAFWGVTSYRNSSGTAPLATVNGEKIGQQEFDSAMNQQQQRVREMAGANFDPAFFDKPEIKFSLLDRLVTQHLMAMEAKKVGLSITDEQVGQIIVNIGAFQQDGRFDRQRYEAVLRDKGKTPSGFDAEIRQAVLLQQLTESYTQNGYAPESIAEKLIHLNEQQRVVAIADLDAAAFVKQVKLSDGAVSEYYNKNLQEFQLPERAQVQYVVLSSDSLLSQVKVRDEEVKQYYEEHQADFGTQEQRHAAHILITVPKQASDAEKQAARTKAEQILKLVKQSPAKFAALAKQYSQDPGSASNGGDLGEFGRGAMVKPFEDSVFSLKVGQVSDLVQTDFGYHIIKLIAVKPAKIQALAEVRDMIIQQLKLQRANDMFAELAEKFNNTVYEQSDSLKPAAELAKLSVQQGVWLSKGQPPAGLWTDKVLQAVFSDDAIKNKRNTAALEVGPNKLLAARVTDYKPASVRPLTEVSAAIQQKLLQLQASELARQQGRDFLGKLQHGEKPGVKWTAAQSITRNQRSNIDPELLQAIFSADTSKLPAYVGVDSASGFKLARIDEVKDAATVDEGKIARYEQQIRQITGDALWRAYMEDARKRASITMKEFAAEEKK